MNIPGDHAACASAAPAEALAETAQASLDAPCVAQDAHIEFLSRVSHELRTPLNAILGFGQLLASDNLSGNQRESVDQIVRAGRHLLQLVNEVLDISRIESGHFALSLEPVGISELLEEMVIWMRPLADARRITVIAPTEALGGDLYVLADRQRLRQVLLNLLSNAVKYNREGGEVRVHAGAAPDGRGVRVQVIDTGEGIPPEKLPRLFTPFDRLGAEGGSVEGSGMGLALSKRLIEAQGGDLGVINRVGEGCTFWLDMAVAAPHLPDADLASIVDFWNDQQAVSLPGFLEPAKTPAPAPSARQRGTILYIEDNEPNRRLVELLLQKSSGARLLTASRGSAGIELARAERPDLILLDMHLPDMTGDQVLLALRDDERTRETKVVVVSADATAVRQEQSRVNGASDYLTKPFDISQLMRVIDKHLEASVPAGVRPA
jgi:CheY-like chemotaxis protein